MFLDAALLHYTQISALPDPESDNVESLRVWITRPDCGNYCIGGAGSHAWGDLHELQRNKSRSGNDASSFFVAFLAGKG